MHKLKLSTLPHTWLIDLDGTLMVHNGYKQEGGDRLLPNAREFMDSIPEDDCIIILTSRPRSAAQETEIFLKRNSIRYDGILYDLPFGERIVVNDIKPGGLKTALAVNLERDSGSFILIQRSTEL